MLITYCQINCFRSEAEKIPYFPSIKKKNKIGFFLRAGAIAPKGKHVFHITAETRRSWTGVKYAESVHQSNLGE
ncbi:hypothetical protein COY07_01365 [Candidatus Peregrinibacteria bacterium CG_4_10_14_0_2_um_filter_43_11]|nr:MAG: hypothetical protein COY07_01365 [Candidatus Peregrinibacteria bacterium CG_4_10_14_0_2_um_filter_43_11]